MSQMSRKPAMQWFLLVLVVFLAIEQTDGRRKKSRSKGSSERWYQEGRLFRSLLAQSYMKNRPALNSSFPVTVGHGMSLVALSLDKDVGKPTTVSIKAQIKQVWTDPRLTWDPTRVDNIQKLHVMSDTIWTPETEIFPSWNNFDYISHGKHDIIMTSSGAVTWTYPATYRVPCTFSQIKGQVNCSFRAWTPNYDIDEIALVPISDVMDLSSYVMGDVYTMVSSQAVEELLTSTSASEMRSVVRYSFTFGLA